MAPMLWADDLLKGYGVARYAFHTHSIMFAGLGSLIQYILGARFGALKIALLKRQGVAR